MLPQSTSLSYFNKNFPELNSNNIKTFLGPNYKEILNFWIYLDKIPRDASCDILFEKWEEIVKFSDYDSHHSKILSFSKNITKYWYDIQYYTWCKIECPLTTAAAYELICMHKLNSFCALPIFVDLNS